MAVSVKLHIFFRYLFSYFWLVLETGSYEPIFVHSRVSKQNDVEIWGPQNKKKFHIATFGSLALPYPSLPYNNYYHAMVLCLFGSEFRLTIDCDHSWNFQKRNQLVCFSLLQLLSAVSQLGVEHRSYGGLLISWCVKIRHRERKNWRLYHNIWKNLSEQFFFFFWKRI